ncbi:MAG: hypothetical protein NC429_03440 [Lachnospiraceae bacterium]|nr:hypothetical protein [Lachnospiraceae bacterium]
MRLQISALLKGKYRQHIFLMIALLLMSMIAGIGNRASLPAAIYFVMFQIGCILIPGTALFESTSIKGVTSIERVLLSYSAGYVLNILIYFLTWMLDIYSFLREVYIFIFTISLMSIVLKRDKNRKDVDGSDFNWIWLIIILFLLSFIVFSSRYALPTFIESNQYFNDLLYWAGDAVELNKEFPPINFRTLQPNYRYHYFSALQLAVVSKVTGIAVARVAFTYSFIQAVVLMGLSAYCLVTRVIRNNKARAITLLLLFFSTGFEKEVSVTYFWHIYLLPMGFNTAYAFEMIIVLLMLIQMKEDKVNIPNAIWMMVFLAICTGTKGPVGAIVMVGIGITCLMWLCEKNYKKAFGYGISALCVFGLIYFLFLQGAPKAYDTQVKEAGAIKEVNAGNVTQSEKSNEVNSGEEAQSEKSNEVNSGEEAQSEKPTEINSGEATQSEKPSEVLEFVRYLILLNPWTVWLAFVYMSICLFKRTIKRDELMFASMIIVGVCLGHFINMKGMSQMYFPLSVFGFIAIMAGRFIDVAADTNIIRSIDSRLRVWIYRFSICIFLIAMSIHTMKFSWHRNNLRDGISNFIGRAVFDDKEDRLSAQEYVAYDWIRTNTEDMAVLLSDRQLEGDIFTTGVFSERHVYNCLNKEELEEERKMFQGEAMYLQQFIDKGIDYIIQTKRFSPEFRANGERCKKVYENTDMAVWQIINE